MVVSLLVSAVCLAALGAVAAGLVRTHRSVARTLEELQSTAHDCGAAVASARSTLDQLGS